MLVIAGHFRIDAARQAGRRSRCSRDDAGHTPRSGLPRRTSSPRISTEPELFHLFEAWESPAALEAHFRTPHMAAFQSAVGGFGVKESKIQRYEVASVGPVRG